MDNASLLPFTELEASPHTDLLPINTRIFPSTVQYGRAYWICLWLSVVLFCGLLFAGLGIKHSAQTIALIAALAEIVLSVLTFWLISRRMKATYRHKVAMSEWQEGVIVFPSGDLVVRLRGLFHSIDTTIESVYLTRADVVNGFAWTRCRPKRHLIIHYLGLDAKPAIIKVCEADLRESGITIASYINDLKSKSLTSF